MRGQSKPIEYDHHRILLKAAWEEKKYEYVKVLTLLRIAGLRISETLQFKKSDIQKAIASGTLACHTPKQDLKDKKTKAVIKKSFRHISLSKEDVFQLQLLLPKSAFEHFIKPYRSLDDVMNRYIKKHLGAGFTTHGYRRDAITDIAKNEGLAFAKEWAGHSSLATTERYVAKDAQTMQSIADRRSAHKLAPAQKKDT